MQYAGRYPGLTGPPNGGVANEEALAIAWAAARPCGVTRLADVTGLDRVGVPVFQAIRPRSRALAVHQGKSLDPIGARIGALMEAVESAHAEAFEASSGVAAFADLPIRERAPTLRDFAIDREQTISPNEPLAWTQARRLLDDSQMQAPLDCVSLDYTRAWDGRLDHTSNGIGSQFDWDRAVLKGLLEVVERDAIAAWLALPRPFRSASGVDARTIHYPWFREIAERLRGADATLQVYHLPSAIGLPALRASVSERRAGGAPIVDGGWGCGLDWEQALLAAVLEALQSRLMRISGARDDIFHRAPGEPARSPEPPPPPPGLSARDWTRLSRPARPVAPRTARDIAIRLAAAGYPDTAVVTLSPPGAAVSVVKVFCPGLGANARLRRRPAPSLAA